jgi:hypothetical protein
MTVMVDELRDGKPYLVSASGRLKKLFKQFSHLTTDQSVDELHSFAARIGLRREWFQDHPLHPHYDLTSSRRLKAIEAGAVFVPALTQARQRRAKRAAETINKETT